MTAVRRLYLVKGNQRKRCHRDQLKISQNLQVNTQVFTLINQRNKNYSEGNKPY